ncbi:hypothetical protein Peur_043821 [Populus x canadensis]
MPHTYLLLMFMYTDGHLFVPDLCFHDCVCVFLLWSSLIDDDDDDDDIQCLGFDFPNFNSRQQQVKMGIIQQKSN